jgi:hypothetical protein
MGNIGIPSKDLATVALYNHDGDTLAVIQYDERDRSHPPRDAP